MNTQTTKIQEQPQMPLKHSNKRYQMIIPDNVEKKIRILCREFPNLEWSGILFYKVEGLFEDDSLKIICKDIYQMDIGSSAYTEFNMSPDVIAYMTNNPELLDCYTSLIHSHNTMASFFSSTDTQTLLKEGSDTNHFVSLIVNNKGKYEAGVTRRVVSNTKVEENLSYSTWGGLKSKECRKHNDNLEYIEWFNLNITIEGNNNELEEEVLNRIAEIEASKKKQSTEMLFQETKVSENSNFEDWQKSRLFPEYTSYYANTQLESTKKEPTLFDPDDWQINYEDYPLDEETINWAIKQTITCSIIISKDSNIDLNKWILNLDKLYKERFGTEVEFRSFGNGFVEFIVYNTAKDNLFKELTDAEVAAVVAYNIIEALKKLPENDWIKIWIDLYNDYLF